MAGAAPVRLVADQLADLTEREGDHVRVGAGPADQVPQLGMGVHDALDAGHAGGQGAMGALHRMSTVLGYGAAGLVTGVISLVDWIQAPVMGRFLDVLEGLPGTDKVLPREDVAAVVLELAGRLHRLFNEMGFECRRTPDGDWFAVA